MNRSPGRHQRRNLRGPWDVERDEGSDNVIVRSTMPTNEWSNRRSDIDVADDLSKKMAAHWLPAVIAVSARPVKESAQRPEIGGLTPGGEFHPLEECPPILQISVLRQVERAALRDCCVHRCCLLSSD